jgi:hypothetical protein
MSSANNDNIGVVAYETTGFPNGTGSAKEAVIAQIKNENEAQNNINKKLGGTIRLSKRNSNKFRKLKREITSKNKRVSSKKVSKKRVSNKKTSKKRESSKRSRSHKLGPHKLGPHKFVMNRIRSGRLNRTLEKLFYGGLEGGEEVSVPQFPSSNTSGPLNPNDMSAKFNSVLLESKQGAVHDKEIKV